MIRFAVAMVTMFIIGVIVLFMIEFGLYNINPVETGDVYTEQISNNPFITDIPDTAIVIDKKNRYVKYQLIYHSDNTYVGRSIFETSTEELAFKARFSNKIGEK